MNAKILEVLCAITIKHKKSLDYYLSFNFGLRDKNQNFVFYLTQNYQNEQFRPLPGRVKWETPTQGSENL